MACAKSKRSRADGTRCNCAWRLAAALPKSGCRDHNFLRPAESERLMEARSSRYHDVYARWQRDPEGFWAEAAQDIDWFEPATRVFDPAAGVYGRWFTGAVCNTC